METRASYRAAGSRRMAAACAVGTVLVAASLIQPRPAVSQPRANPLHHLPAPDRHRVQATRELVARVRADVSAPSFASRIRGLIEATGRPVPPVPQSTRPSTSDLAALPLPLRTPAADLAAAIDQVSSMFHAIPAPILRWAMHHGLRTPTGPSVLGMFRVHRPDVRRPGIPVPVWRKPSISVPSWIRDHRGLGDRAALLIASALDRDLPLIRAATVIPAAGLTSAQGCDVLDKTPNLCIGSSVDNVYTQDENLLIDLGGNDTYQNSAGASYFATPDGQFGPFASVNVDLGGNDLYDPKGDLAYAGTVPAPGVHQLIAEGAAVGVGLGMLVDAAGDDRYDATAPNTDPAHQSSYTWAQGAASTVLPGFAALLDLGGSDRYSITGPSGTNDVQLHGQGYAFGLAPPTGGLIDAGIGDDTYSIDAGTGVGATAPPDAWTQHFAIGQGYGSIGTGVLADSGGKDSFSLQAHGEWTTTDGYPFIGLDNLTQLPLAEAVGQGTGGIGNGYLLEGPGDTTYSADTTSTGVAYNSIDVQGIGSIGTGVLDDPSGNDTYSAIGSLTYDHPVTVDDTCTQPDPDTGDPVSCSSARSFVHTYNTANFAMLQYAQGFGYLGGQGLLHDATGNDTYRSVITSTLHTQMHDAMTSPSEPARFDVWGYGVQWNVGQGVGQGEGSDGVLLDESGNDTYVQRSSTVTEAEAVSDHGPGTPRVTALEPYRDGVMAQGAGYGIAGLGALLDLAGTGDHFEVASTDSVSTSPNTGGALRASLGWPIAHAAAGAGNATGVFVALGQSPVISLTPQRSVCPNSPPRRFGAWADCPEFGDDPGHQPIDYKASTPTVGLAPFSTGQATSIALTPDTPESGEMGFRLFGDPPFDGGNTIQVGATLLGPDGKPLAGKVVHFDLEALLKIDDVFYKAWATTWEVDAVTDADGVARATLPLEDMSAWGLSTSNWDWRLAATYDGEPSLYPAYTAKPFQLT